MNHKTILITGATGSLGQKLVEHAIKLRFKKIIVFSRDEHKQYEMRKRIISENIRYYIGDIRDFNRLLFAFRGVDYVIHSAALKHVDTGESNPWEVINTNVCGAKNIIDAAILNNVKKVVAVSTDKAVNPINLYGTAKKCADSLFLVASIYSGESNTKFSVARFANFANSRGSVIEYYYQLKKRGVKILPITDFSMKRYFISLERASEFCFQVLNEMQGGEIFIPKMVEKKIVDIALKICPDSALKNIGIRKGEKIREELMTDEEKRYAKDCKKYWKVKYEN